MKWLRRLFWFSIVVVVMLIALSQAMAWWWGSDKNQLSSTHGAYAFTASRDAASGTWNVKAKDQASLWYAFGYVQSFDREFQTELVRLAARGEASRLFGDAALKNDRLMRFSRRAAEEEYEKSDETLKTAARAYVAGREAALSDPKKMDPIEYQIMGITRQSLPPWEASDIMAIARFHAWQLSFDVNLEQLYVRIEHGLGKDATQLLLPSESPKTQPLYSQPLLFEGVSKSEVFHRDSKSPGLPLPEAFFPKQESVSKNSAVQSEFLTSTGSRPPFDLGRTIAFNWDTQLALRGASNLWVIADPRVGRALTLCNDTHLRFTWPASLYPIRYDLEGVSRGTGFMLPGIPAMVVGTVESTSPEKKGDLISWGITLASYGDTQDLIRIDAKDTSHFVKTLESYPVRDMQSGQIEVRRIEETWTPWGPRVDTIFTEDAKALGPGIVSLDWIGYKRLQSPFEFFLKRDLNGAREIVRDLHERLPYPNLNFTWIQRDAAGEEKIGHLVSGWMRAREHREINGLSPLKTSELATGRRDVQPRERDYFLRRYDAKFPFFLATANQRIWEGPEGMKLAHSWEPDTRARAIVANFEANARDPAASQTDYRSPQLMAFLKSERRRSSANRLCADSVLPTSECLALLSRLDSWDGVSTVDSWQTTLAALWHADAKQQIFMALVPKALKDEMKPFAKDWHRRSFSSGAMARIMSEAASTAAWEKDAHMSIADLSLESFRKALATLVTERGADTRLWEWGAFHRIDWLHPLVQAPEPWGSVIHDSLLGPRPELPGALDSPGRFEYSWDADHPLDFPATHGAALRMCTEFKSSGGTTMRWSAPTGPSGNPFSKYAKQWSFDTFFEGRLSDVPTN
ncbi:MAG: penicillin acylase family protein [Bdellovibrionota bacterium]